MTEFTFENFVPIASCRQALRIATAFGERRHGALRLLVLRGRPGVGKTHLMRAIAAADMSSCRVIQTTAAQLMDLLVFAVRSDSVELLRRWYIAGDLLLVEDLQVLSTRPATQQLLASLLTTWIDAGVRVVMTVGGPRRWLRELERGIPPAPTSHVLLLQRPNRRDMRVIVLGLAKRIGVHLHRDVADDIAAWSNGDVRRAVGAIQQLTFEAATKRAG